MLVGLWASRSAGSLAPIIPLMAGAFRKRKRNAAATVMFTTFPRGAVVGAVPTSMVIHMDGVRAAGGSAVFVVTEKRRFVFA